MGSRGALPAARWFGCQAPDFPESQIATDETAHPDLANQAADQLPSADSPR